LESSPVHQRLVHTGQHYDDALSTSFFRDLNLPAPDINLGVGSGTHSQQTAHLLMALEKELTENTPALLMVYGDINSTLAAALVAAKLQIPLAHVEAGLRSFDRSMPEEVNRIVTDQLSQLLFTTSPDGAENLLREGIDLHSVHFVGNPMIDTLMQHLDSLDSTTIRSRLGIGTENYAVATIHRPSNVDDAVAASDVVEALRATSELIPVVLPLHPRGRELLTTHGLNECPNVKVIDPLGYLDFMSLIKDSRLVITDSGGVQEETTVLGIPCLTLRPNTERPVTITQGTNKLVDASTLTDNVNAVLSGEFEIPSQRPTLWDGHAGERIAAVTEQWLRRP
jgi:UDP-N-acetylglucosamine 2-epimerase (non-hydrolysing)